MALTAHPFHPVTQELLPGYRDAYLRGDLSGKNTELVDAYLKANPDKGGEAFQRFHTLKEKGHDVRPVGWLQNQFDLIRTEPARFRRRAGSIIAVAALLSGAAFASNNLHSTASTNLSKGVVLPVTGEDVAAVTKVAEASAATTRMTTVSGRILDENGHPLIGATVLDKARGRGVSTDAQGNYTLAVPANQLAKLQVGYGGYDEDELQVQVKGHSVQNVTLVPRSSEPIKAKKHHWWQF
ncbi:carboxypeptidase-like regulatory domain-containing protein [Hymenobacter sp. DH14]|uniref:Carboxypeptidase-like regulatory domain-containing protein n=1 Tax=Hymenobacter cyanobacteriorum TaxID=2926463 RepID=A0A9X1VJ96_9BACT|nr:carboxypeptidase-like regulatory domain-containing protein [Hymenobacter cyanobacteriorum]MCI1189198.1 carboxypeptidase-like regulatory domain-containing protein [Hymenobacter cyanobacteriorum]